MSKKEPEFVPRSDQVDFSNVRWCPVINCVVFHKDQFLLVKRSEGMRLYPGYWNGISGFIDDTKSLDEKVVEEITEELGVIKGSIQSIELRGVFNQEASDIGKTWIVHAVKVEVNTKDIKIDWEASEYDWTDYQSATEEKKLLPGFDTVLDLVCNQPNRIIST